MTKFRKGQHSTLNVTQKAAHRIKVGLGWDPNEQEGFVSKILGKLKGKELHHDLDLSCILFDEDYQRLETISAVGGVCSNANHSVYHSGDNIEGYGDGDDEEISVELKNIPKQVAHIVFYADIKTGHSFAEILNPEIRLVDGYSDYSFLNTALNITASKECCCYIFVHVYRKDGEWFFHYLDRYLNKSEHGDLEQITEQLIR